MTLTGGSVTYLWGFASNDATSSGCPIRIYLSDTYLVWNKIAF